MILEQRRIATQKTLDEWRGRAFDWSSGDGTCAHLLRAHLVNMGHDVPEMLRFKTVTGAVRALRANGWSNLTEMLDALLPRRPSPSFMRMGDVALAPGDGPLDSIFICAGPLKVFGWREGFDDLVVMDVGLDRLIGVWQT